MIRYCMSDHLKQRFLTLHSPKSTSRFVQGLRCSSWSSDAHDAGDCHGGVKSEGKAMCSYVTQKYEQKLQGARD